MAFGLGLHREASYENHTPYETEMRRRLWWEIYLLDVRASEDRGSLPVIYEGSYTTAKPSNINDAEFNPQSPSIESRDGWTDTTFGLMLYEISSVVKKINYPASAPDEMCNVDLRDKQHIVDKVRNLVTEKYLAHCNTAIPFQWFASTCAKIWFSRMQIMLHYPVQPSRRLQPDMGSSNNDILCNVIDVVENMYLLETNPDVARWSWCSKSWSSWHALAIMLAELCTRTNTPLSDRAWTIANLVFEPWSKLVADSRSGTLWRPIKKLYEKALQTQTKTTGDENVGQELPNLEMIDFADCPLTLVPRILNHNSYDDNGFVMLEQGDHPTTLHPQINHNTEVELGAEYALSAAENVDIFNWNSSTGFDMDGQLHGMSEWSIFESSIAKID
jgi:hypothetical protein